MYPSLSSRHSSRYVTRNEVGVLHTIKAISRCPGRLEDKVFEETAAGAPGKRFDRMKNADFVTRDVSASKVATCCRPQNGNAESHC